MRRVALLFTLPFLLAAAPSQHGADTAQRGADPATASAGVSVVLAARPGTPLDAEARRLVAHDIAAGRGKAGAPLVLTGSAPLGAASDRPALFVQLQSARDCGSGGCSTTVYLWQGGAWRRVLDGVGGKLTVSAIKTKGMANLVTEDTRYIWSGHDYRDINPAPAIDLRRRR